MASLLHAAGCRLTVSSYRNEYLDNLRGCAPPTASTTWWSATAAAAAIWRAAAAAAAAAIATANSRATVAPAASNVGKFATGAATAFASW